MGDVQIIFAIRKVKSIGNTVVKNRVLCIEPNKEATNQKCNANGCLQCPRVTSSTNITVNGKGLKIPHNLNCKTNNAIYLWECNICDKENFYFGRTTQKCHSRTSGHMNYFNNEIFQKSALSMHAQDKHPDNMTTSKLQNCNFKGNVTSEFKEGGV